MAAAMRAASWYDALALALRGERLAPTEPKRVLWRLNRASASEHLGMRQGALLLLLECAHSPDLPLEARCHALRLLASACISCGFLRAASDTARLALEAMDPRSPATLEVALLSTRARLLTYLIGAAEARDAKADQLREASEALEHAQSINPPADVLNAHLLGLLQGRVAELRGCAAEAEVGYTSVLAAARADNSQWPVLLAEACLGSLMRRASRLAEAELHLEEAERLAAEQRRIDGAFEVAFELHGLRSAQGAVREASTCLRNCPRLYPLVTARTPIVRAYERLTRSSP
jgi:tetratricopeptide (TPR) repeat protein